MPTTARPPCRSATANRCIPAGAAAGKRLSAGAAVSRCSPPWPSPACWGSYLRGIRLPGADKTDDGLDLGCAHPVAPGRHGGIGYTQRDDLLHSGVIGLSEKAAHVQGRGTRCSLSFRTMAAGTVGCVKLCNPSPGFPVSQPPAALGPGSSRPAPDPNLDQRDQ